MGLGDLSPQGNVAVGVLVGLISASLQAIGLTLQRKSHLLEDEKDPYDLRRPPYKRRRWQLGMFMFVISNIVGSTIQITTLPLPVLSTLQASGLVFNTIFATLILGESFTRYSLFGTILVSIGAVLIGVFGAINEPAHTLDQLLILLVRRPFIIWMVCTFVIVIATLLGARVLKHLSKSPRYQFPYAGTLHVPRLKLIRGVAFGFVSGILSAHCLLLAKSAVELIVRTIVDHSNQFNHWQSWVILIVMIGLALTQLYYLHRGLKVCSTSVLYPFVFCVYNIIAILDGLIYFHQASQLSGLHAGLIALGTIILLSGVLCLSWRLEEPSNVHPGVSAVPPTQTSLAPGMGLIDEPSHSPRSSGLFYQADEEARPGERQPLLTPQQRKLSAHQRTPSLPLVSPYHQTTASPRIEAAKIWAELDDDDDDEEVERSLIDSQSSLQQPPTTPPPHFLRSQKRYRSKSSTISSIIPNTDPRRRSAEINDDGHSFSPLAKKTQTMDPKLLHHHHSTGLGISRRTSAPVVVHPHSRTRRRTTAGVTFANGRTSLDSIGQEDGAAEGGESAGGDGDRRDDRDLEDGNATVPRSRHTESGGGWRTGFGWLRRLTRVSRAEEDTSDRDTHNPDHQA
ncbi:hypothetical protein FQN54_002362 [Arachnomyces sp. PD_36]|nr:hypothetical protein FQN54_002362 [Arachnomyces sp. PD_36]